MLRTRARQRFPASITGAVLTTPWVLTEVADALSSPDQRHVFVAMLADLKGDSNTILVPPTSELFYAGCDLYSPRSDEAGVLRTAFLSSSWTSTDSPKR